MSSTQAILLAADVFVSGGVLLAVLMILGLVLLTRGGTGARVAVAQNAGAMDRHRSSRGGATVLQTTSSGHDARGWGVEGPGSD